MAPPTTPETSAPTTPFSALGFDPAPGDAAGISALTRELTTVLARTRHSEHALGALAGQAGLWQGEAAAAFAQANEEMTRHIQAAAESLGRALEAVQSWLGDLETLQDEALRLEEQARAASQQVRAAQADPRLNEPLDESARHHHTVAARALADAQAEFNAVVERARILRADHQQRARAAARLLRDAGNDAPDAPGLVDRLVSAASLVADIALQPNLPALLQSNKYLIAGIGDVLGDMGNIVNAASATTLFIPGAQGASGGLSVVGTLLNTGAAVSHGTSHLVGNESVTLTTIKNDMVSAVPYARLPSTISAVGDLAGAIASGDWTRAGNLSGIDTPDERDAWREFLAHPTRSGNALTLANELVLEDWGGILGEAHARDSAANTG